MNRSPGRFRGRLLLGAVLPALLMVSLLEMVFLSRYQADIERAFHERSFAIARQLGPAAEFALFSGGTETLRVLAEATRESDRRILSVNVLAPDGKVLVTAGAPPPGGLELAPNLQVIEGEGSLTVIAPILRTSLPVDEEVLAWGSTVPPSRQLAGYVVLDLSQAELDERKREMLQITLGIMLGGLLLAGWLSSRIAAGVLHQLDLASNELHRQKELAEALARTDALTGLANRRAFDAGARREIERARRYGTPLALVIADLDHFKTINDRHGHHVGDLVLQEFARILGDSVRGVDLVGRWGGEEFAILMPGTDLDEARLAAERMRQSLAEHVADCEGHECRVTASFGVAAFVSSAPTMDALLGRADAALYRAKDNGRNRVETG